MNRLTIIGNLTKDPEIRTTANGKSVCNFTVAVNRRRTGNQEQEADFFRVAAWNALGENCAKYLEKGRKVCVVGPVSVRAYNGNNGPGASLEVIANEVEFLSTKVEYDEKSGMQKVNPEDNPFVQQNQEVNTEDVQQDQGELPF